MLRAVTVPPMWPVCSRILLCLCCMQAPPPGSSHDGHATQDRESVSGLDPVRDAGVPVAERLKALTQPGSTVAASAWRAIESCDRCPAMNDLSAILAGRPAAELESLVPVLAAAAKDESKPARRAAAARSILALSPDRRPAELRDLKVTELMTACQRGRMSWDPKDFQVLPGTLVRMRMQNGDSMLHNMLLTSPGSLAEIGVAAEKLGEGLEGKRRQFVPDSPKVMAVMGLVAPGETGEMWFFTPTKPGTYVLVCTYPGHWRMMNGKLQVR